jgi:hypothetical protein
MIPYVCSWWGCLYAAVVIFLGVFALLMLGVAIGRGWCKGRRSARN